MIIQKISFKNVKKSTGISITIGGSYLKLLITKCSDLDIMKHEYLMNMYCFECGV